MMWRISGSVSETRLHSAQPAGQEIQNGMAVTATLINTPMRTFQVKPAGTPLWRYLDIMLCGLLHLSHAMQRLRPRPGSLGRISHACKEPQVLETGFSITCLRVEAAGIPHMRKGF